MQKKKWERPDLIVLVRGKPEEDILLACKWGYGYGANAQNNRCHTLWIKCPSGRCMASSAS